MNFCTTFVITFSVAFSKYTVFKILRKKIDYFSYSDFCDIPRIHSHDETNLPSENLMY